MTLSLNPDPSSSPVMPQLCIQILKQNPPLPTSLNTSKMKPAGHSHTTTQIPSLKLSTLSLKTTLLPSKTPTGNKSLAWEWSSPPPGRRSSMASMKMKWTDRLGFLQSVH
eukprot:CCRYP_015958-RA/>CCRYP_015958-RA protein AED:0.34 eAED:0.34 QI:0/-1/0/1/-1/0/1/0/109